MLALPSLARVPRTYTIPGDMAVTAGVVCALLDAGLISPRTAGRTPAEVLTHGLAQWRDRQLAGCRRIHVGVEYYEAGALHRWTGAPTRASLLILRCVDVPPVFIGRALERLGEHVGRKVLHALGEASSAGLPILTPAQVLGFAEFCHWQGEGDERSIVAEYTAQGETYDGPTRAQWGAYMPAWATAPTRARRGRTLAEQFAEDEPKPPFALAAALEDVRIATADARRVNLDRPDFEEVDGAFCLWLRWKRGADPEALVDARIVDDYFEEAAQSVGVGDVYAEAEVLSPEDVVTRLQAWQPVFALARAVEQLLRAAGVRDDE